MRVALVTTRLDWHGGEGQVALLVRGLRQRGHHCLVLAHADSIVEQRMRAEGFDVRTFPGRGRTLRGILTVRSHLQKFQADVVYMNDPHAVTACWLALWGLPKPIRVAARRVDFPIRARRRYREGCDKIFCVSRAVARVCDSAGLATQVELLHEGCDPAHIEQGQRDRGRVALGLQSEQLMLLTVAKLTDHKGHAYLLDALPAVIQRFPRVVTVFAGDGELRGTLEARARQLGVASHVRFLGYRHDIPDLLAAADLFVLPSHLEGLCTSLIDAMLAEKPIVTTTAGGIPDLVGNRGADDPAVAWMVAPRDSWQLTTAILEAISDPQRRADRAYRGRLRARRCFTADRMVDNTVRALRNLISDRRLSRAA